MLTSARPGRPPLSLESLERVGASARRRSPRQGATCSSTSPRRSARSRSARPSSSAAAHRASRVSPVRRAMQTRRGNDGCAFSPLPPARSSARAPHGASHLVRRLLDLYAVYILEFTPLCQSVASCIAEGYAVGSLHICWGWKVCAPGPGGWTWSVNQTEHCGVVRVWCVCMCRMRNKWCVWMWIVVVEMLCLRVAGRMMPYCLLSSHRVL